MVILYNLDPTWSSKDAEEIQGMVKTLETGLEALGHPLQTVCLEDDTLEQSMAGLDPAEVIVFNWCEEIPGIPYSCALVAGGLEKLGFTYTGADADALQLSLDKPAVKKKLEMNNIPIPAWQVFESDQIQDWHYFPAIVKPAYEHSSVGITRDAVVHTRQELKKQVRHVLTRYEQPVMVEDFIDGREFHVTVIGNGRLQVFPIAEMDFSAMAEDRDRLCTYDSKFTPASRDYQMIKLQLPAKLSGDEQAKLEEISIKAYRATNCRDFARLDIRQRGNDFYVLDVNPNADISPDTSPILSAGLAGYSFEEFGSLLVHLASHRHPVYGGRKVNSHSQEHGMAALPV